MDITIPLHKPDFQILQWSSKEINSSINEARILGAPLQKGHCLYKGLQRTYLATNEAQQSQMKEDEVKLSASGEEMNNKKKEANYEEESENEDKQKLNTSSEESVIQRVQHSSEEEDDGYV